MESVVKIARFSGLSSSDKEGVSGAYKRGTHLNTHDDQTRLQILPETVKNSGATVTELVIDGARVPNGDTYFIDEAKKIYKRTAAGSWSVIGTVTGDTNGMGCYYWKLKDTIYFTTDTSVSTYGRIGGTPTFSDGVFGEFIDQGVSISGTEYPQSSSIQGHWKMEESSSGQSITYPESGSIQGHWKLDEVSGTRVDETANNNDLTNNNTVTSTVDAREGVRSADFEAGNSEFLSITDAAQTGLDITGDLSFSAFIQVESTPGEGVSYAIFSKWNTTTNRSYWGGYQTFTDNKLFFQIYDGSSETTVSVNKTLTPGTWYHVGFAYDASAGSCAFFVDGVQEGSTQTGLGNSINNGGATFRLGSREASGLYFDGLMDDAVIWNTLLTDTNFSDFYATYPTKVSRVDASSNSNDLIDVGFIPSSSTAQEGENSADLERSSTQSLIIANGDQTGLNITGSLTVAAHVRLESNGNEMTIIGKWETSSDRRQYRLYVNSSNKLVFAVSSDGTSGNVVEATGSTSLSTATDYHVTGVYTPSTKMEVFLDAVSDGSNTTSIPSSIASNSGSFAIGADTLSGNNNNFDGLVDDAIVLNTALATTDISTLESVPGAYTPPTSVTEDDDNSFEFTPEFDPINKITVNISDIGTGNWTVTVHDDNNGEVGTSTVANGSLSNGVNDFDFSPVVRPLRGATYHVHITSTVADGKITSGESIKTYSDRLISPKSKVHPITEFIDFIAIGNERYITTYDGLIEAATDSNTGKNTSSWTQHSIVLPSNYEVTCISRFDEYVVAGAELRGDNVDDFSKGLLVFWDGTSPTFNYFIEVEEGGVQAVLSVKNILFFIAGNRGDLFAYVGQGESYRRVKRFPNTSDNTYVRSLFSSVTTYQGLSMFGMAHSTDSTVFEHGVYSYGSKEAAYSDVLRLDHTVSSGTTTGTTLKIGMVKAFGTDLFIGWDDNGTYGVDLVEPSNDPYGSSDYETLIFDNNTPHKTKNLIGLKVNHSALVSGESIRVGYKLDRGSFTMDTANSTVGDTETIFDVGKKEFKELESKITVGAGSSSPDIYSLVVLFDDNNESTKVLRNA